MTPDDFAALALSLPDVVESSHFGNRDFRAGGRIFATLPSKTHANLNFTPDQQLMMLEIHAGLFAPLAKSWGARGWTSVLLADCPTDIALSALRTAQANVLTKKGKSRR
jgi:hypothetical protein